MSLINKTIHISISPNVEKDDLLLALKIIFNPFEWKNTRSVMKLEREIQSKFGSKYSAFCLNSGRSALFVLLKSLGIGSDDEVIVQGLTCVAVSNSIKWCGATPVYVDIDKSLNISADDLKSKITKKTKAIIVQNTFGVPADYKRIKSAVGKRKILIIEDLAHGFGATINSKKLGTLGDAAFLSFGRDKLISSVFGGAIITNNSEISKSLENYIRNLPTPTYFWIFQQIIHPIITKLIILPTYSMYIGKVILVVIQKIGLLSKAVYDSEKMSVRPEIFPQKMPGALATLALNQLEKLDRFNKKRLNIALKYQAELSGKFETISLRGEPVWLRFPVLVKNKSELLSYAKRNNIILGDWYRSTVYPINNLLEVNYSMGDAPYAEKVSNKIINLPTYPTMTESDVKKVIKILKIWTQ